ncbi:hypothetical protein [Kitasatospora sp. GAS204B]|uniref:hypothetical protein n=1 Tax=unclassified Kitasatospora TaxID=2633591 RepID=UPI002473D4F0|nr:hypothetical protein [Kitasatospora sp. GAS204B]MDH6118933.1 hypothetical protein [Kitasatospora sp. GAS204B]
MERLEELNAHIGHATDPVLDRSVLAEEVAAGRTAVVGLCYGLPEGTARVVAIRGMEVAVPPGP